MNLIKKISGVAVGLALALAPVIAVAATGVTLSPTLVTVAAGQTFTATVSVNPSSGKIYTGKVVLSYPPELVSVMGFNFTSGLLPLAQPGYDSGDTYPQTSGTFIKTAGFTGGLSASKALGIVTFKALKSGTGVITVANGTLALNGQNQNDFDGVYRTVTVTVPAPVVETVPPASEPEPTATVREENDTVTETPVVQEEESTTTVSVEEGAGTAAETQPQASLLAQAGGLFGNLGWWTIIIIVGLAYGIFLWIRKREK